MKLLVGPEQMLSGVMRACYVAKKNDLPSFLMISHHFNVLISSNTQMSYMLGSEY